MGVLDDIHHEDELFYLKVARAATIDSVKRGIATGDLAMAKSAWNDLDDYMKTALWVPYSRGGPFTNHERQVMKSREWRDA